MKVICLEKLTLGGFLLIKILLGAFALGTSGGLGFLGGRAPFGRC